MATRRDRITDPELDLQQFVVVGVQLTGRVLGTGAYGSVEEAAIPGATIAAKKVHSNLINLGSPEQVRKWISDFVEECKLMSKLRHPSIVQFLGICYVEGSRLPVLLMEKLQTNLDSFLETTPNIPLDTKVHLLLGTASGVVYLHAHDPPVIHRDLTARNVLIDSGFNAKIADLGVARIVTIQPGQLAATMTGGPGNNLYMPPEAVPGEGAARYSTSIDIFSFGVIELFTLIQLFPKDLKPHNYLDPRTRRLVARSEIERREDYVTQMKRDLGENHPLVGLTLDCLEYAQEDRPSAEDVLRRLEQVERTLPRTCAEPKLELIQRVAYNQRQLADKETQLVDKERQLADTQRQLAEKNAQITQQQTQNEQLQVAIHRLQAEKTEQVRGLEELTTLQQQQLETQHRQIDELARELQQVRLQPSGADVLRPQPQAQVGGITTRLSVDPLQPIMTGREATAELQVVTSSNQPYLRRVTVTCKLVHTKSGQTSAGRVTKIAINKHTLSFTPTLRGRHEVRVRVNGQAVRDSPLTLLVAPVPASLRKPTCVISGLSNAWGVTTNDKGDIIVCERGAYRVSIFGMDGAKIRSFGSKGSSNEQFIDLRGVIVGKCGCIYVTDHGNNRIQKFSPDGVFLVSAGTKGTGNLQFKGPDGIHYNKTNGMLYVADENNHRVQVLTSDLAFHSLFGREGCGDGELRGPGGVCCDEVGNVYVADFGNSRVQVFTAEGELVCKFGSSGRGPGYLLSPQDIAVSSGLVYVVEFGGYRVSVFALTGEFIGSFGGYGSNEGEFNNPAGVTVAEDNVILTDSSNNRIQIF